MQEKTTILISLLSLLPNVLFSSISANYVPVNFVHEDALLIFFKVNQVKANKFTLKVSEKHISRYCILPVILLKYELNHRYY